MKHYVLVVLAENEETPIAVVDAGLAPQMPAMEWFDKLMNKWLQQEIASRNKEDGEGEWDRFSPPYQIHVLQQVEQ